MRAYQRSLKREPGLPSKEDFDRAVQFAEQIYKSLGEDNNVATVFPLLR